MQVSCRQQYSIPYDNVVSPRKFEARAFPSSYPVVSAPRRYAVRSAPTVARYDDGLLGTLLRFPWQSYH